MTKETAIIADFKNALQRFSEILVEPKTAITRDAAIQRFEFSFDLAWKVIKTVLEEKKGIICNSPNECIREAYQQKFIEYDKKWMQVLKNRNLTAHTYNEKLIEEIFIELPTALELFTSLLAKIETGCDNLQK